MRTGVCLAVDFNQRNAILPRLRRLRACGIEVSADMRQFILWVARAVATTTHPRHCIHRRVFHFDHHSLEHVG